MSITIDDNNKLHMACLKDDVDKISELIKDGADISETTKEGWSPIRIAVSNNQLKAVEYLLDFGADSTVKNNGYSPLYIACQNGYNHMIKLLIESTSGQKKNILNNDKDGWKAIQVTCSNRHCNTVEYLLNKKIAIPPYEKYKILHIATEENNINMVKFLLDKCHKKIDAKDSGGWTALHIAAREDLHDLAKYLIKNGKVDVNEGDNNLNTPLHIASQYGSHDVAQLLINNKASIDYKNHDGWTALHTACQNESTEVVNYLLEYGAKVDLKAKDGQTALHIACENDNKNIVQLLIDNHANINLATFNGWTALQYAVYYDNPDIVEYLLKMNPSVSEKNQQGLTALDIAYQKGNEKIIKMLIDYITKTDQNVNKEDLMNYYQQNLRQPSTDLQIINESEMLINEIKKENLTNALNIIASHKISFEYIDKNGWTALHWAAYMGNEDVAEELINNDVELKRKTKFGFGDDLSLKGKTTSEIEKMRGYESIVNLLRKRFILKLVPLLSMLYLK